MTMTTRLGRRAAISALTLGAAGLLLACADAERPVSPPPAELTAPGIHPVMVIAKQSAGAATLELHLKRVDVVEKVASFQGELTYDRATLTLETASIPAGITGAWNEVRPGTVRFTGVSMDGIADGAVLVLEFAATGALADGAVRLNMEEVVASEGFVSLTGRLRQRAGGPVLSVARP